MGEILLRIPFAQLRQKTMTDTLMWREFLVVASRIVESSGRL
jgi:hypothetical protein